MNNIVVEDFDLGGEACLTLSNKNKYGTFLKNSILATLNSFFLFFLLFMFLESAFHLWAFGSFNVFYFLKLLFCVFLASLVTLITSFFKGILKVVVTWIISLISVIWFLAQVVYSSVFKQFLNIEFVSKNNAKVYQYYGEIIQGIMDNGVIVSILFFVPLISFVLLTVFKKMPKNKVYWKCFYVPLLLFLVLLAFSYLGLIGYGKEESSPYDLVFGENDDSASFKDIGVVSTALIQAKNLILPRQYEEYELGEVWVNEPVKPLVSSVVKKENTDISENEISEIETVKEIDRSPNILDIDFVKLSEEETNPDIADIHRYFATVAPTNKNEYTGMFKGYNLIFLSCEAFCNIAVDEEYTPTLYKLTHEGIVCNNFYNPRTGGSTSDGEFVNTTSLLPAFGGAKNYKVAGQNSMPFAMGNVFNRTYGITSKAFHDNDYEYYGRDISYPAMGYAYKGVGNGVEIGAHWPESDLEMMEATVDEFLDDDLFNVYYMTVSGHLNYSFSGNYCASKHYEEVKDMPYSNACKAYLACQKELDLALEYLLNRLEEKGILDKTVICFTGDHWPYGLSNDEFSELLGHPVEENFELYKSNLVLYCSSVEEPIYIDKQCCSLDIVPTLLNLFGFDYDSRLLMGRDILSDSEGFVRFLNKSYITDRVMFNAQTKEYTYLTDEEISDDYLKECKQIVNQRWNYSLKILDTDYYKYICDACGINIETVEQNYVPDYSKFTK